jgi:hypothetical protein
VHLNRNIYTTKVTVTESPRNVKRGEKSEGKMRRAPTEAFLSLPFYLHTIKPNSIF